jgi:hypothetical protein
VNQWIRTQSPADAVIDFEAAGADPANPDQLDARYDARDGLHLNPLGYQRLADAVDLDLLAGPLDTAPSRHGRQTYLTRMPPSRVHGTRDDDHDVGCRRGVLHWLPAPSSLTRDVMRVPHVVRLLGSLSRTMASVVFTRRQPVARYPPLGPRGPSSDWPSP